MSPFLLSKFKSLICVFSGGFGMYSALCYIQTNEMFYENMVLPTLHLISSETSHNIAITAHKLGLLPKSNHQDSPILKCSLWNIEFGSPIGMAAGFDKHGEAVKSLHDIGFSFVEVGSVTPVPQSGNEKPRVFRLSKSKAIINRYGFNSHGHDAVYERLKKLRNEKYQGVIGVNLGKNKDSVDPIEDYVLGIQIFSGVADYLVINISSPNTPGLRDLQEKEHLETLLTSLVSVANECKPHGKSQPPLLLKLAPDLDEQQLTDISQILLLSHCRVDGIIISNTSLERDETLIGPFRKEKGGLSGKPIADRSTEVISRLYFLTKGKVPIIGVGGVFTGEDAFKKIKAGASLIEIYTAYVYHGPPRITKIKQELQQLLRENGFKSVNEAVGKGVPLI